MGHPWFSTSESLPLMNDRVLVISKFGHISNCLFTNMNLGHNPRFEPEGFEVGVDVKWWMPIPADGWYELCHRTPKEGETALVMGAYGQIFNGMWKHLPGASKSSFTPFVWPVMWWMPIPELPKGVTLKY